MSMHVFDVDVAKVCASVVGGLEVAAGHFACVQEALDGTVPWRSFRACAFRLRYTCMVPSGNMYCDSC